MKTSTTSSSRLRGRPRGQGFTLIESLATHMYTGDNNEFLPYTSWSSDAFNVAN